MSIRFKKKILSIDGGGIRGIIPAIILNYIEKKTRRRIADMFDLVAGTSTGGILALGLTKRNSDSGINCEPEYTAAELRDFYSKYGKKIFSGEPDCASDNDIIGFYQKYGQKVLGDKHSINALLGPKFGSKGREDVLKELLGNGFISDAVEETLITSYDTELRAPIFFTSEYGSEEIDSVEARKICVGFKMFEAAMATTAAPTFFTPYKLLTSHRTDEGYYSLIDGGVVANNPSLIAMTEMISTSKKRDREKTELERENLQHDDILVVSLGTGSFTRKYKYNNVKKWGQLQWVNPMIDIVLDSQSESVAYQLQNLMLTDGACRNYYRFQFPLSGEDGRDDMDNASSNNIEYLEEIGEKIIEQKKHYLDELCDVLVLPSLCESSRKVSYKANLKMPSDI
jgi:uncharacterized protein